MAPACSRGSSGGELNDSGLEAEIARVQESIEKLRYDGTMAEVLNNIDDEFARIRFEAEASCARVTSHPWSPKLRSAQRDVKFWKLWLSEIKLGKDFSIQRSKIRELTGRTAPTLETAVRELRGARKKLREVIRHARELRYAHLADCSERASAQGQESRACAIQKLMNAENLKATYARLQGIMKNTNSGAMSHLIIEEGDGNMTTIHDQKEINNRLLECNRTHFSQADGTPFTRQPLTGLLGRYGTNEHSNKILEGKFDVNTIRTSEATKEILRQLKLVSPGTISVHISANDVGKVYKKWRESTSTSPSGLHLGHYKALFKHEEKTNGGSNDKTLSDRVFSVIADLINMAIRNEHVYKRWTKVVNAMIEKIPGYPLLTKLRVIHLIESNLNLMTGILWGRWLMWHCENLHELGDDRG